MPVNDGTLPQTKATTAPTTIPERAPMFVSFLQYRERIITGPNAAPKPAQANPTKSNTELSGFQARIAATIEMTRTEIRPAET